MHEILDVNTGQVVVTTGAATLPAVAIGSCIAIAAFDPRTKNAGDVSYHASWFGSSRKPKEKTNEQT